MDRRKLTMIVQDPDFDKEEKLKIVMQHFKDEGIKIPEGCCVCVRDNNKSMLVLTTSKADKEEYERFAIQMMWHGGTSMDHECGRDICSGTYTKIE